MNLHQTRFRALSPLSHVPRTAITIALLASTGFLAVGASAATAPPAAGTKAPSGQHAVEGHVVSLDQGDIMIDLTRKQGLKVGTVIELWRHVRLRHPVTHKWITDKFRTGTLVVSQVGDSLSLARVSGKLLRPAKPGDIAIATVDNKQASSTPPATPNSGTPTKVTAPPTTPSKAPLDAESQVVCDMFSSLTGAPPINRIRVYEQYVRAHPTGKYAPVLYEEAQALRQLLSAGQRPSHVRPVVRGFRPPRSIIQGTSMDIAIELSPNVTGAAVHVRQFGDDAYQSFKLFRNGDGYWATRVSGQLIVRPGVEYFIEASNQDGVAYPVVGAADLPKRLAVLKPPSVNPTADVHASGAITTDYASYKDLNGTDYAWQTEGQFGLLFQEKGLRAVRTGFGVYRGAGGSLHELDDLGRKPRSVGLTYGYVEGEYGFSKGFGVMGRLSSGLQEDGITSGYAAAVRIGGIHDTNLQLGFDVLGSVGTRGFAELQLGVFEDVPIIIRSEVTDQPAGTASTTRPSGGTGSTSKPDSEIESIGSTDVGTRGIIQVGYRFTPEFTFSGRLSYQGRTIQHSGPGFGAGLSYEW